MHYAGNLQGTASSFLVLGLCAALALSLGTIATAFLGKDDTRRHHGPTNGAEKPRSYRRSTVTLYVTFFLLVCLYAGALMQILTR